MSRLRALWLVSVVMGSALVGISGTLSARAASSGLLEVCKAASNGMAAFSFTFTVDGTALPHAIQGGTCSAPLTLAAGNHQVVETQTPPFVVTSIVATPSSALLGHNPSKGTATVAVIAGAETIVKYFNEIPPAQLKVCKQANADSPLLVGTPFTFTENGGAAFNIVAGQFGSPQCSGLTTYPAGTIVTVAEAAFPGAHVSGIDVTVPPATNVSRDLLLRTVTLTVEPGVNVVTYTNELNVAAPKGFVEICKHVSDSFVSGTFSFTIVDSFGTSTGPLSVAVHQCSGPIQVSSGPVTISEVNRFPYFLDNVSTSPASRLISDNLSNGTATVSVVAGDSSTESLVTFFDGTNLGRVQVCKRLTVNSGALTGDTFSFPFTTSVGLSGTVAIVAAPPGQDACVFVPTPNNAGLPLGSAVSITETSQPNVLLTSVMVSPASAENGSTGTTANITVVPGVAVATLVNEALGTFEICKDAADAQTSGKPFTFVINYGSSTVSVNAGQCSPAIQVPAGTAQVNEQSIAKFHLVSVTATGPDGSSRLVSGPNPAIVSVPFGGVGNETLVTFTNAVNTDVFQICKTTTAANGSGILLGGSTFTFAWSYVVDGTLYSGTTSLTLPPGASSGVTVCSGLIGAPTGTNTGGIPVVQSNGSPVIVRTTEALLAGVHVLTITYAGSGRLAASNLFTQTASMSLREGINILTYDNEPNSP